MYGGQFGGYNGQTPPLPPTGFSYPMAMATSSKLPAATAAAGTSQLYGSVNGGGGGGGRMNGEEATGADIFLSWLSGRFLCTMGFDSDGASQRAYEILSIMMKEQSRRTQGGSWSAAVNMYIEQLVSVTEANMSGEEVKSLSNEIVDTFHRLCCEDTTDASSDAAAVAAVAAASALLPPPWAMSSHVIRQGDGIVRGVGGSYDSDDGGYQGEGGGACRMSILSMMSTSGDMYDGDILSLNHADFNEMSSGLSASAKEFRPVGGGGGGGGGDGAATMTMTMNASDLHHHYDDGTRGGGGGDYDDVYGGSSYSYMGGYSPTDYSGTNQSWSWRREGSDGDVRGREDAAAGQSERVGQDRGGRADDDDDGGGGINDSVERNGDIAGDCCGSGGGGDGGGSSGDNSDSIDPYYDTRQLSVDSEGADPEIVQQSSDMVHEQSTLRGNGYYTVESGYFGEEIGDNSGGGNGCGGGGSGAGGVFDDDEGFVDGDLLQLMMTAFADCNPAALEVVLVKADWDLDWACSSVAAALDAVAGNGNGQQKPCRHFLNGECLRKDCLFSHDFTSATCRYWLHWGGCKNAEACPFVHDLKLSPEVRGDVESDVDIVEGLNVLEISDFPSLQSSRHTEQQQQQQQQQQQGHIGVSDFEWSSFAHSPSSLLTSSSSSTGRGDSSKGGTGGGGSAGSGGLSFAAVAASNTPPKDVGRSLWLKTCQQGGKAVVQPPGGGGKGPVSLRPYEQQHSGGGGGGGGGGASNTATGPVWVSTGATVSGQYKTVREEAAEYAKGRNRCFQNAQMAFRRGDKKAARDLARKGRELNDLMKERHKEAAQALYCKRNPRDQVMSRRTMDLHGLHVQEVFAVLEEELPALCAAGLPYVTIITGTGHHSKGSNFKARLLPAVERICTDWSLPFTRVSDGNGHVGTLQVALPRERLIGYA